MRLFGPLVALGMVSCAPAVELAVPPAAPMPAIPTDGPVAPDTPLVPPLRYEEGPPSEGFSEDADFRVSGPPLSQSLLPPQDKVHSFVFANGLHAIVVERRGFPMVAARLVIDTGSALADDVGGRRAFLLGATFLHPLERVIQTTGACSVQGCVVTSRGLSKQFGEVLARIAKLVSGVSVDASVYERRLANAARLYDQAETPLVRNIRALMFGSSDRDGEPPPPEVPTLSALEDLRNRTFVPSAATLIVVGDTTESAVRGELDKTFAGWSGPTIPRATPTEPPLPKGPRIVLSRNGAIGQLWCSIVARGPSLHARDFPAVLLLTQILGGKLDSALFHHVRESLGAAYSVGARVDWYRDASVVALTGSFDRDNAMTGARGLLNAIEAAREIEASADDLARAKTAVVAEMRHAASTDEGIAARLGAEALLGLRPEASQARPLLVQAVSAAEVRAAARRYLDPQALRVVLVGKPEFVAVAQSLGLGAPVLTDRFGRPLPPQGPAQASAPPHL
jgi:zinc protease